MLGEKHEDKIEAVSETVEDGSGTEELALLGEKHEDKIEAVSETVEDEGWTEEHVLLGEKHEDKRIHIKGYKCKYCVQL